MSLEARSLSSGSAPSRPGHWLWWRGRAWHPTDLEEPLRLCADPAVLREPAWVLVSPDPPSPRLEFVSLQDAIWCLARWFGVPDALCFFQVQSTEADWELAGRLYYDFGAFRTHEALLYAKRRAVELGLSCQGETFLTAFLAGCATRFLEDRHVPPRSCPLLFPRGIFLGEVSLLSGFPPVERSLSEPGQEETVPPRGWLLFTGASPCLYSVCAPLPPSQVQIDRSALLSSFPW